MADPNASNQEPLLHVTDLRVELDRGHDVISDITFALRAGEILGIVGESGSGKTTIAAALLGHVRHGARITAGKVNIGGVGNVLKCRACAWVRCAAAS